MDTELNRDPGKDPVNEKKDPKKEKKSPPKDGEPKRAPSDQDALYLASSESLADWNRPEEDEAWKDL